MGLTKTCAMLNRHAESAPFCQGNEILEKVGEYKYVGKVAGTYQNQDNKNRRTIFATWAALSKHSIPVMTDGSETWGKVGLAKNLERVLRPAERTMERKVRDGKRTSGIIEQTHVGVILARLKKQKWSSARHASGQPIERRHLDVKRLIPR